MASINVDYSPDDPNALHYIEFDPKTDIYSFNLPLPFDKRESLDPLKHQLYQHLVQELVDRIAPDYLEQTGFELMQYKLVIVKFGD
jgi:hypothetical protein